MKLENNDLLWFSITVLVLCITCGKVESVYERTDRLESSISYYEIRKTQPEDMQIPKTGLWKDIDLGMWHFFNGDYFLADSFIWEDLISINKYGVDKLGGAIPIDYYLLGLSAIKQSNFEESFEYLDRAEKEFHKIEYERGVAKCYYARALSYKAQGKYEQGLGELDKALEIAESYYRVKKYIKTKDLIVKVKKEIGSILEITKGEFHNKNCYEWYTEAISFESN